MRGTNFMSVRGTGAGPVGSGLLLGSIDLSGPLLADRIGSGFSCGDTASIDAEKPVRGPIGRVKGDCALSKLLRAKASACAASTGEACVIV